MSIFRGVLNRFMERSTWVKAFVWLAASQTVYFIMLGVTIPAIENKANGMRIMDLKTSGYSSDYVTTLLETIGEKGRHLYLTQQLPLDLIYPALMAITGTFFIALFAKKINPRLGVLMFIPMFGAAFDYLENIMVSVMLLSYPKVLSAIVMSSSLFTIMKTVLDTLYLGLLLVLFVIFLLAIIRSRKNK